MAGAEVVSPVVLFDFDQYYKGGCLCELLAGRGHRVTYVTPADLVSAWCANTHDQGYAQQRLIELGVTIVTGFYVSGFDGGSVQPVRPLCRRGPRGWRRRRSPSSARGSPRTRCTARSPAAPQDLRAAGVRTLQKIGRLRRAGRRGARHLRRPPASPGSSTPTWPPCSWSAPGWTPESAPDHSMAASPGRGERRGK